MPSRRPCLGPGPFHLSEPGKSRCKAHGEPFAQAKLNYIGFPQAVRKQALARAGHRCEQCGSTKNLEVDHIKPQSRGGSHTLDNARVLCRPCHQKVTGRYPWRQA